MKTTSIQTQYEYLHSIEQELSLAVSICIEPPAFILPQYAEEYQHELEQQGEAIDAENAKLLAEEQFWLRLYLDLNMSEYHDELLVKLDSVRQQMTNLSLKLSKPDQTLD